MSLHTSRSVQARRDRLDHLRAAERDSFSKRSRRRRRYNALAFIGMYAAFFLFGVAMFVGAVFVVAAAVKWVLN